MQNFTISPNDETAIAVQEISQTLPADSLWHQIHELESLTDGVAYLAMIRALCLSDESVRAAIAAECEAGLRQYDACIEGQRDAGN